MGRRDPRTVRRTAPLRPSTQHPLPPTVACSSAPRHTVSPQNRAWDGRWRRETHISVCPGWGSRATSASPPGRAQGPGPVRMISHSLRHGEVGVEDGRSARMARRGSAPRHGTPPCRQASPPPHPSRAHSVRWPGYIPLISASWMMRWAPVASAHCGGKGRWALGPVSARGHLQTRAGTSNSRTPRHRVRPRAPSCAHVP